MNGEYTAQGIAVPDSLVALHELMALVAGENPDVCADDISMMETAVIEIAGNLVEHGRPPGQVRYQFTLTVHSDRLQGHLADSGEELPGQLRALELQDAFDEDGRGLFLAHAVLDDLAYARTPDANTWVLTRTRRPA